jgi:putative flippase GtrA
MSFRPSMQFVRFLVVGVLNTGFSYGVYAGLLYLGLGFVVANILATVLGILFSFRSQSRLVFHEQGRGSLWRFAGVWAVIWLINIACIAWLVRMGFSAYGAGAMALVPTVLCSYVLQKFLVFRALPSPVSGSAP